MSGPAWLICGEPGPYAEPRELWEFLTELRAFDQEDVAVQWARADAIRHLCWKTPPYDAARAPRRT